MDQQSAIEKIALIRRVIDESRQFTFDNGKYYLTWDALTTAAIFAEYAAILTGKESLSVIMAMREPSRLGGWPVGAKFIALIWGSSGVSMTIIGFVGPFTGALHSWAICPAVATVVDGAFAMSSLVYRLKWALMVGIAWWVGALAMFAVRGIATLPMYGVMMILFGIIPGLVFYRNSKKNAAGADAK